MKGYKDIKKTQAQEVEIQASHNKKLEEKI